MQAILTANDCFADVYDYCIRIEFQGRGTLHIHLCAWVEFHAADVHPMTGHK